jgi:hypothetical protein
MTTEREGGCLCGRVRHTITGEPAAVYLCHCVECQRQSGSGTRIYHDSEAMPDVVR